MTQYAPPPPAFFADDAPQAEVVWRMPKRAFFGPAAEHSGAYRMDVKGEGSWLNAWAGGPGYYLERAAQLFVQSPSGGIGASFTTRGSDRQDVYNGTTIGSASTAIVDTAAPGWGAYVEVQRDPGGGTAFGAELDAKNKGHNVISDPYNRFPFGATLGWWIAAGGDPRTGAPANPSTAAITIGRNGHTWNKGIVFDAKGLTGTDGLTGTGIAISLAKGHKIQWHTPPGDQGAALESQVENAAKRTAVRFRDNEIWLMGATGLLANFYNATLGGGPASAFLTVTANGPGRPVVLSANGTDPNIDLRLAPRGSGLVWLGRYQGGGGQVIAGSITVRDSSGIERRLAVLA